LSQFDHETVIGLNFATILVPHGPASGNGPARPDEGISPMATLQDLTIQIAQLQAENEALKAKATARQVITCKVSDKGCLSVYGLGRFPVTLYGGQWLRLLDSATVKAIKDYIEVNRDSMSWKD
jgi:hypothetical protein